MDQNYRYVAAGAALLDAWVRVLDGAIAAQLPAATQLTEAFLAMANAARPAGTEPIQLPELTGLLLEQARLGLALAHLHVRNAFATSWCGLEVASSAEPAGYPQ